MAATMPDASALIQVNSVQPELAAIKATSRGPLTGVNSQAEILALTRQAHRDRQLKQQAAAAKAGVKESQYSSALNGTGHFAITWLYAQDDAFLLRWIELVLDARRLSPERRRAVRASLIGELVRLLTEDA